MEVGNINIDILFVGPIDFGFFLLYIDWLVQTLNVQILIVKPTSGVLFINKNERKLTLTLKQINGESIPIIWTEIGRHDK